MTLGNMHELVRGWLRRDSDHRPVQGGLGCALLDPSGHPEYAAAKARTASEGSRVAARAAELRQGRIGRTRGAAAGAGARTEPETRSA